MNNSLARSTGFIYLLLFSVFVSTAPIAGKIGLQQDISPIELLGFRFILAAAVLWVYFLCFKRDASSRSFVRPRLDRAGLIACMQVAVFNCTAMCTYFFSLVYLDASLATVIYVTGLIPAVMLLLMIRGEYPSRLDLFRFVMALIGIYLFVNLMGQLNGVGLLITILAAFLFALFMTLIQ